MSGKLLQEKPVFIKTALQENSEERLLDRLELLPYAEALSRFIETSDTPMTVGLQGDWGTGKTSMLNMLRGTEEDASSGLLNSRQCLVINFETWSYAQFNDRKSLPMACLFALTGKLEEGLRRQKGVSSDAASDAFKKATGKLSSVLKKSLANASVGVMGISIPVGKALQDDEVAPPPDDLSKQMMEFRDNFSEMVDLWVQGDDKRRVVICVDDLDRVQPVIALELLESIKNFLDVEGCVFVLAVDYEVVQQGMKEKLGVDIQKTSGKSFFDKIIQLPFNMPKSSYDLKKYIGDLIEIAGFPEAGTLKRNDLDFLEEMTLCSIGGNPRSIKRVMNYARLLNIIREKTKADNRVSRDSNEKVSRFTSRDSKILYSLICMQIAWPEIFAHFMSEPTTETIQNLESWEYLEKTPELKPLFDRSPDTEKLKNDVSTFIDTLFSMIDEDGNGQLSDQEFEPVQKVLAMARFTNAQPKPRPRDLFLENALTNASGKSDYNDFILNSFKRSKVYTSPEIKYRPAGKRYVTLVYKRKQLGSVVTLKNHPLIIRLNSEPDAISREVTRILENEDGIGSIRYVRDFEEEEGSLTGFGDAIVDVVELMKLEPVQRLRVLNAIITATERFLY